jgi:hypothetical protein
MQAMVMSSSIDSEAPKNDAVVIRLATDRAQGGNTPAFFTEESLLRLEDGLSAQREQHEERRFSEPDAPGSSSGRQDWPTVSTQIEPISENTPLAPGAERPKIPTEEPAPSRSWRRRKVGLLLCALLLAIGAAALGVLLKARPGASTDATPVNIEAHGRTASVPPNNDEPRQPITNAVKPSPATPLLPPLSLAPPNEQPSEAQGPARPAVSETPAPPNEQPVEAQGLARPAASETPASPQCNIPVCQRSYRSFRASDCTYQPFRGPRRICQR